MVSNYLVVTFFALGVVMDTRFGTNRPWFNKKSIQEESSEKEDEEEDE